MESDSQASKQLSKVTQDFIKSITPETGEGTPLKAGD